MNRNSYIDDAQLSDLYQKFLMLHQKLDDGFLSEFGRSLPLNETLVDRWKRAEHLQFGRNSSIYDSSLVFGSPEVGSDCWIGPFTIIDGSGGLSIGNNCTISSGVHIYTHDNVKQTLTSGQAPPERSPVSLGDNVYIAPNAVITKGVSIGSCCLIGAFALVNKSVPDHSIVFGQPGHIVGSIRINGDEVSFDYKSGIDNS